MTPELLQNLLAVKFGDDHSRISRMQHFVGLLKSSLDGLAGLGVVVHINTEGLGGIELPATPPSALASIETAISQVRRATD